MGGWGGGGELESKHGGALGEHKMMSKNTCEGIHLIKKLPAISLQASQFSKNELLHTSFSRILARFEVIIYGFFSRTHFMEACFMFQWELSFSYGVGRAFFISGAPVL